MTLQQIEAIICKEVGVFPSELHSAPKKFGDMIELKYIIISLAMSFGRRRGDLALRERDIAEYYGHNIDNPCVVSYARKWVNGRCKVDKEFAERYYSFKEIENVKYYGNDLDVISYIIQERYSKHLLTLATTNLTMDGLEDRYHDRIISRFYAMFNFITMKGSDFRKN